MLSFWYMNISFSYRGRRKPFWVLSSKHSEHLFSGAILQVNIIRRNFLADCRNFLYFKIQRRNFSWKFHQYPTSGKYFDKIFKLNFEAKLRKVLSSNQILMKFSGKVYFSNIIAVQISSRLHNIIFFEIKSI